jgi:hypothetical protein
MKLKTEPRIEFNSVINNTYSVYQRYYLQGLKERLCYAAPFHNKVFQLFGKVLQRFDGSAFLGIPNAGYTSFDPYVGQYKVNANGKEIRMAIDAHDNCEVRSRDILEWSDIYFKANKWEKKEYGPKIRPIVNGNGKLGLKQLSYLKSLRNTNKEYDISFISRIWGGREHNIRLFETLAQLPGKNKLLAIFIKQDFKMFPEEIGSFIKRLEKAKVPWTWNNMPSRSLWEIITKSRVSVLRQGKHLCIPWRMLDLLCLGTCVAFDSVPFSQWPEPLRSEKNYIDLGIRRDEDGSPASFGEYQKIPGILSRLIEDEDRQRCVRLSNIDYFEKFAAPEKVAEYILREVQNIRTGGN